MVCATEGVIVLKGVCGLSHEKALTDNYLISDDIDITSFDSTNGPSIYFQELSVRANQLSQSDHMISRRMYFKP